LTSISRSEVTVSLSKRRKKSTALSGLPTDLPPPSSSSLDPLRCPAPDAAARLAAIRGQLWEIAESGGLYEMISII
jgi:hypothetical protein